MTFNWQITKKYNFKVVKEFDVTGKIIWTIWKYIKASIHLDKVECDVESRKAGNEKIFWNNLRL